MKFSMLINVKKANMLINVRMPTIVGIFTFMNMMNIPSESLKAGFVFQQLSIYEQFKFHTQLSMNKSL